MWPKENYESYVITCHLQKEGDSSVSTPSQLQMYQGRQPGRPFLSKTVTARVNVAVCVQRRSLQYGPETMQGLEAWEGLYPVQCSCLNFTCLFQLQASAHHLLNNFVKFKQQSKWLTSLSVLLTCFTKAYPVTYVFKAAAKLKCIVLWLLTRLANINFYEVYSGHNIPSTVNNFEDIGPTFNFSVKVSKSVLFWFKKLP